jgi:hypothetical protein
MPVAYSSLGRFVDDMNVIKSLALQRPLHQAHHGQKKAGREEAKAAGSGTGSEISKVEKPDAVPTGGCMPIGLTE